MNFSKFFSNIQEAPWYRDFLNPVINEIDAKGKLLDVGTGSGKLLQILSIEKGIECTGVDTNTDMLKEAEVKLKETNTSILKITADEELPFEDDIFSYLTFCNILFHLEKESIHFILKDAQRVMDKEGKIIVLTPTGKGNSISLSKHYFSAKNLSIYIWFNATKRRAKAWAKNQYLKQYAADNNLQYESQIVMNGFAQLEVIKQ